MNYITILTPDNIEIEYRLAGAGSRIAAAVVDFLVQGVAIVIISLIYYFAALGGVYITSSMADSSLYTAIAVLLIFCVVFVYYILIEIFMDGQTIGKKLLGLRVIRENGAPINLTQSLIRNILKLTVDLMGVGVVMIMFSKKCKRLGDMAASTVVIAVDRRKAGLAFMPLMDAPVKTAPLNNRLVISDREYRLLKDYFERRAGFTDGGVSACGAFGRYFEKKFGVPGDMFTEEVLKWMLDTHLRG